MLDHTLHNQLDDLMDVLEGLLASISPGCSSLAFQGRAIGVPAIFIRLRTTLKV